MVTFGPALLGWAVLLAAVAGCGRSPPAGQAHANVRPAVRKVALQTDWFPQAEHGGFYQALVHGFYREAGLDVAILPGGPGAGIKLKVARGDAEFGMLKSDDIMMAASRGMPLVMIMATMQHDPQALLVHAGSPVKTLRDLDGRTVIAPPGMTWIPYVQKKFGITFNLAAQSYGLGPFRGDRNAIQQCVVTNEPFILEREGIAVRTLALADSGYDCYPVVFSQRQFLQDFPEVARAFVGASIRGWRDYLEGDPAAAHRLILERNPQMTAELLAYSRGQLKTRRLVQGYPARGEDIGQLSTARLTEQMQALRDLAVLEVPVDIAAVARTDLVPAAR